MHPSFPIWEGTQLSLLLNPPGSYFCEPTLPRHTDHVTRRLRALSEKVLPRIPSPGQAVPHATPQTDALTPPLPHGSIIHMIHIGFTGTRKGMTTTQIILLNRTLDAIAGPHRRPPHTVMVHHGAALGADEQFHKICLARGFMVCIHPTEEIYIKSVSSRTALASRPSTITQMPPSSYTHTPGKPPSSLPPGTKPIPLKHRKLIKHIQPTLPPMRRNLEILNHSDMLIAAPDFSSENRQRSGSWATIRHAKKRDMMMRVLFPELAQNDSYGTG